MKRVLHLSEDEAIRLREAIRQTQRLIDTLAESGLTVEELVYAGGTSGRMSLPGLLRYAERTLSDMLDVPPPEGV